MRKRIYEIIELSSDDDKWSSYYDVFMMIVIFVSIIPLAFKEDYIGFEIIEAVTAVIFVFDYLLRLVTADFKLKKGLKSYVLYPFTPMAVIDLLAILPAISMFNEGLKIFKIIRLFRTFRVLRIFKAVRYSRNVQIVLNVFRKQKESLLVVGGIAILYILVSALIILNVEPETFENYFDAVYWATVSLTTMGYGDIYPITVVGRIFTMISSVMGIAVVALPAGIITSGLLEELNSGNRE
ncbi:MAG: ion transporter [Lachnospiraceae bacterium]|nr:ion transporter [Lachnospiraceae bacterium]